MFQNHQDSILHSKALSPILKKTKMNIKIKLLADHEEFIPTIASWLHSEWGHLRINSSCLELTKIIQTKVNRIKPPIHIIALANSKPVGVAVLKKHEMKRYPDKENWLGSLFVKVDYRGDGIGQKLINEVITIAQSLSINKLYLQTEQLDGGLYNKLGWTPIEVVKDHGDKVLIMEKHL